MATSSSSIPRHDRDDDHDDDYGGGNDRPVKRARIEAVASPVEAPPVVLGQHTLVPSLADHPNILSNTVLSASHGRLPPYCIIVGDRTRVTAISSLLSNVTLMHDHVDKHGVSSKRMSVAVGEYDGVPIVVAEHGMGCASTEIILRELIADTCMSRTFVMPSGDVRYESDAKYVIRVGSCAGINTENTVDAEKVNAFDIVVTDEQVGVSGTDLQSLSGGLNWFRPDEMVSVAKDRLNALGFVTRDGWPCIRANDTLAQCIHKHASNKATNEAYDVHMGGNISKDSLYAEAVEEAFTDLRTSHNVKSSEMEFATISVVAQQHNRADDAVNAGMVLYVLGTIPGNSFETDAERSARARNASASAALDALHEIATTGHKHVKSKRSREQWGLFGI